MNNYFKGKKYEKGQVWKDKQLVLFPPRTIKKYKFKGYMYSSQLALKHNNETNF